MSRPYDRKLDRAEEHLIHIEELVSEYRARKPYEVAVGMKGKKRPRRVHSLRFTSQPDDAVALILGDFLYNVRASLDYLMSCIAPSKNRSRIFFPILWQGVWERPVKCENKQRRQDRELWNFTVKGVDRDAVAILQREQPPKGARHDDTHALALLNRLRNIDAHRRLHVVSHSLWKPAGTCRDLAGNLYKVRGIGDEEGLPDGAYLNVPDDAVDVQITGTPAVFIRMRPKDMGGYRIESMRDLLSGTRTMADLLRPFDRVNRP